MTFDRKTTNDLEFQLWRVLTDLDAVAAFERTARWGNTLAGWASEADGTRTDATRDEEVARLAELLQVDPGDAGDPRAGRAAEARAAFLRHLLAAPLPGDRSDRDPDWHRALRHQRQLRELESMRATRVPGAVLRLLAETAPPGTPLRDACERVGVSFAHPALRDAWEAEAIRREVARLARRATHPKGGRPPADRRPPPRVSRVVLGRELVAWAVAAWRGEPHEAPAWCPEGYRPPEDSEHETLALGVSVSKHPFSDGGGAP